MKLTETADGLLLSEIENFDIALTLDCGQAFRWSQEANGVWSGIAYGRLLKLKQDANGVLFYGVDKAEFDSVWYRYFDLDRDYAGIITAISGNDTLKNASSMCGGIRILRQDPFETLCSFIISQNNNIPRIKGIIDRLCHTFGDKINDIYAFPTAKVMAGLTVEDLAPIRSGFRARYLIDAAQKAASDQFDFAKIEKLPLQEARAQLMTVCGVGEKVADCVLLFGLGRTVAFPKDVWIKRAMAQLFDDKLPECAAPYAGIVQQYIYHYIRTVGP